MKHERKFAINIHHNNGMIIRICLRISLIIQLLGESFEVMYRWLWDKEKKKEILVEKIQLRQGKRRRKKTEEEKPKLS